MGKCAYRDNPQTFITQQTQASFVIWNGGGGTLTGTVSVPAPFSIVSGASFSLLPGQSSDIPIIVSWTTSDGRVMYMCLGKASACAALGDLARQIACAQQGQSRYCNAQEIDWRRGAWEAPPPDNSKTPVASLTP